MEKQCSRRQMLKAAGVMVGAATLAACQPKVVEKIVKETVVVEKEVEKVVEQTVVVEKVVKQEVQKVVKETVEVTKEVAQDWPVVRLSYNASAIDYAETIRLVNRFQSEKHIRIELEPLPGDWSAVTDKMLAGFAAGDAPDVLYLYGPFIRKCIDKAIVLSLNPFLANEPTDFFQNYVQGVLPGAMQGDQLYGLPKYCGIWGMFYNKDLFEQAGLPQPDKNTWDSEAYLESALKILQRDKDGNMLVAGTEIYVPLEFGLSHAIWSWGGEVCDPKDHRVCKLSDPPAMAALNFVADLQWKYKVMPTPAEIAGLSTAGGFRVFPSGKSGSQTNGSWWFGTSMAAVGKKFRYGCLPVFKGPTGKRETLAGTEFWLINKQTEFPEACWTLLKFLNEPEFVRVSMTGGQQPILRNLAGEFVDLMKQKAVELNPKMDDLDMSAFIDGYDYCRPMVWFENHTQVMEILQPVLDQIFVTGTGTVDELIPPVCEKINALATAG